MNFRIVVASFALSVLLGAPAPAAAPAAKMASDKSADAIKDVVNKVAAAWETLDPANAAPFYAKDANLAFFDLTPLKYTGWDEYAAGVKKAFGDVSSLKFSPVDDLQVHRMGNIAWTTATSKATMTTKGGTTDSLDCRWTLVLEKRGKEWLITHEHFSAPIPAPDSSPQSLYKRLGGYDALAAVTDDFIGRLANDPQLHKFFVGHAIGSLKHIRQLIVDQLCEATGGPCVYIGEDMKTAHAGLGINESDWKKSVDHLVATLDKFHVPEREKKEVLSAISGMKKDIATGK